MKSTSTPGQKKHPLLPKASVATCSSTSTHPPFSGLSGCNNPRSSQISLDGSHFVKNKRFSINGHCWESQRPSLLSIETTARTCRMRIDWGIGKIQNQSSGRFWSQKVSLFSCRSPQILFLTVCQQQLFAKGARMQSWTEAKTPWVFVCMVSFVMILLVFAIHIPTLKGFSQCAPSSDTVQHGELCAYFWCPIGFKTCTQSGSGFNRTPDINSNDMQRYWVVVIVCVIQNSSQKPASNCFLKFIVGFNLSESWMDQKGAKMTLLKSRGM